MVRFHWHVEDGLAASVQPGQLTYMRDAGVLQAMVEIEVRALVRKPATLGSGQGCAEGCKSGRGETGWGWAYVLRSAPSGAHVCSLVSGIPRACLTGVSPNAYNPRTPPQHTGVPNTASSR